MKKILFLIAAISFQAHLSFAQPHAFSGKIRKPEPTSFYSETLYQNDIIFHPTKTLKKRDFKNSTNDLSGNIQNPEGTLVIDGQADAGYIKQLMEDPNQVVITEPYAEFPYKNGNVTYRIPVTVEERLPALSRVDVQNDIRLFVDESVRRTNHIPGYIDINHDNPMLSCELFGFQSVSSRKVIYHRRLNVACVFDYRHHLPAYAYVCCSDAPGLF